MQTIKLPQILTPANPVVNAEFRHQRFVIQRGRVGWIWIAMAGVMVLPALLIALAYTIAGFLLPIMESAAQVMDLSAGTMPSWLWLGIMTLAMYPVVTLITFGLSANSVRREKSGHTWDYLRLTQLDPEQIVIGKWWASLRALNGDHGMVMVLRLGVSAAFVIEFGVAGVIPATPVMIWTLLIFLLLITALYSFLDAGLTAALGIAGAMVDIGGPIVPFLLFSTRVFTAFVALMLWIATLFAMQAGIGFVLLITTLGIIGYILVIWLVLRIAQRLVG